MIAQDGLDLFEEVADVNHRHPAGLEPLDEVEEPAGVVLSECAGRFVEDEYPHIGQEGASDLVNRLGARNFAALEKSRRHGDYDLVDVGPSLEYSFLFFNLAERGNCVSASIPLALAEAVERRRIQRGDRVMLIGTGAGLTLGAVALTF